MQAQQNINKHKQTQQTKQHKIKNNKTPNIANTKHI